MVEAVTTSPGSFSFPFWGLVTGRSVKGPFDGEGVVLVLLHVFGPC